MHHQYLEDSTISIPKLAEYLGKTPEKRTLPNGKEIEQIVWTPQDMKDISKELHNNENVTHSEHIIIDGPAPAWLVAGIVHECHPASCSINTPQGIKPVGCMPPAGEGKGENIEFTTRRLSDNMTIVEAKQIDPSVPLDLDKISNVEPPDIGFGKAVVLSGRMPNLLFAGMGLSYAHKTKAVGFYQPGTGATVSITHDPNIELGSIIPEEIINEKTSTLKSLLSTPRADKFPSL